MNAKQATRIRAKQTRWIRVILAAILIGIAASWPIVEIGPTGPLLLRVTPEHGADASDLLALVPLALAISVILPLLRPRSSTDADKVRSTA